MLKNVIFTPLGELISGVRNSSKVPLNWLKVQGIVFEVAETDLISTKLKMAPKVGKKAFSLCALLQTPVALIQELEVGVRGRPGAFIS
jgi:hypothetical protein